MQIKLTFFIFFQSVVVEHVRMVVDLLCKDIKSAYEPLWEMPCNTRILKDALMESKWYLVLFKC